MGDVQDSIAAKKTQRNSRKPNWHTANMIVAYNLSVVEEAVPSTYKEAEISSEFKMCRYTMMEKMNSPHKNGTWKLSELTKKELLVVTECSRRNKFSSLSTKELQIK